MFKLIMYKCIILAVTFVCTQKPNKHVGDFYYRLTRACMRGRHPGDVALRHNDSNGRYFQNGGKENILQWNKTTPFKCTFKHYELRRTTFHEMKKDFYYRT